MRMKKIIANPRSFNLHMNSPCQYQKKHMDESIENMDTDFRV